MLTARRVVVLCGAVMLSGLWTTPALAAPRTTRGGRPLRWQRPDITLSLSASDLPTNMSVDQALDALRDAAPTWSSPAIVCTAMSIRVVVSQGAHVVENDGVNIVAFRKREWCRDAERSPHISC